MEVRLKSIAQSVGIQEAAVSEVVAAVVALAPALAGVRGALARIHDGASGNYERTVRMGELLGEISSDDESVVSQTASNQVPVRATR
jgi:hypothetical protein